jgi:DNA-directed RNA polymerase specialized sigma24 family protein
VLDDKIPLLGPAVDPTQYLLRKWYMWSTAGHSEVMDVPGPVRQNALRAKQSGTAPNRSNLKANEVQTDWAALVMQVRDHQDRAAFAALFRHFAPRVKAFLMKSGAGATLAEECAQDVMATLWQKAYQFDPARASVATWVFTIARNRRIDMLRKSMRASPEDLDWGPQSEPDQAEIYEIQQDHERLGKALAQLPPTLATFHTARSPRKPVCRWVP